MPTREDQGPIVGILLVGQGFLERLSDDPEDTFRWMACELASLVENRFFVHLDPLTITREEYDAWVPRATRDDGGITSPHDALYRTAYWIVEGGVRKGTLALASSALGNPYLPISSLYTFPAHRRTGVAGRALHGAMTTTHAIGLAGLRIPTHWTWQPTVSYYVHRSCWVWGWKHSLVFLAGTHLPRYRVDFSKNQARFLVQLASGEEPLLAAARRGPRLTLRALPGFAPLQKTNDDIYYHAYSTFAVALALAGWPLIRSSAHFKENSFADAGAPEALAEKIAIFEALDVKNGFDVRTPRIPGLPYEKYLSRYGK
jgi:hypothetical protein